MPAAEGNANSRPDAVIGAGDLVSFLHRTGDEPGPCGYRFNLFRFQQNAEATHALRPADLRDIVKVCQVLALTIADDGLIADNDCQELLSLASQLEAITQRWSESNHGKSTAP